MKTAMIGKIVSGLALVAVLGYAVREASAQTGSRIGNPSQPQTSVLLRPPSEIDKIRKLLQKGKTRKAIKVARDFNEFLDTSAGEGTIHYRYFALSALCTALSVDGQLEEAVTHCDTAISMRPNHWQAINSRGIVHYLAGRFEMAARDYRHALELEPNAGDVTSLLKHNLDLAEGRKSGS